MVKAVTIGTPHPGSDTSFDRVVIGPEVPVDEQLKAFKRLCNSRTHPEFSVITILASSTGAIRSNRFKPETGEPEAAPLPEVPTVPAAESPAEQPAESDPEPAKGQKPAKFKR